VQGTASREAVFPGDSVSFHVQVEAGAAEQDVEWSGGGEPATGRGPRFATRFATGGSFTVVATLGTDTRGFTVAVCPIDAWLEETEAFYGPSVHFSRVRVKDSRVVFGGPGMGWTCNDVVRFKRPRRPEDFPDPSTLIHEMGHVWEHQDGQAQVLRGLLEQVGRLFGRDPYDYGGPAGLRRATSLTRLSKESQAMVLQEYWRSKRGDASDTRGVPFATPGYIDDLRRLIEGAGIGTRAPRRPRVAGWIDSIAATLVNAVVGLVDFIGG
jgi:hypothetical protein